MNIPREVLLIIGLFVCLVLFIVYGPSRQPEPPAASPTTYSTSAEGASALYTWLGQSGFRTERLQFQDYSLDDDVAALLMLRPREPVLEDEATTTLEWVERGGTLILADDNAPLFGAGNALFPALKFESRVYSDTQIIERGIPTQPVLDQPVAESALMRAERFLVPQRDDYTVLLHGGNQPLLVGIQHGRGYIYLSSSALPFTNEGLRDEQNARLVLNLLRRVPRGGRIQFDELHHGYLNPPTPTSTLLGTPWGWAATYLVGVVAGYLILSGRRFGRPIPFREEQPMRSSAEYVESMADLLQRGGKHADLLAHYRQRFKRQFAFAYGLSPSLDDAMFADELVRLSGLEQQAIQQLLARLSRISLSDAELIQTIAEADRFLQPLQQNTRVMRR